MGTFNLFARDLQVPLELEKAAPALASGHMQQVDTAEVNGKLSLCNSVMGLGIELRGTCFLVDIALRLHASRGLPDRRDGRESAW